LIEENPYGGERSSIPILHDDPGQKEPAPRMSTPPLARDGARPNERALSWYLKVGAAALGLIVAIWLLRQGTIDLDAMAVRRWLIDLGPAAPLAYMVVYALQVILAPLPGLPIGAAAGFTFGLAPALIYGACGLGAGVIVALLAGRTWGLRLLARVAGPEAIAKWERLRLVNAPLTWLVIFLGPSPDLILFVAGMTRIPLPRLFLVALIGRAPAMVAATVLGAGALDMGPWLIVGATLIGALAVFGGVLLRRFAPVPVEPTATEA
jgi:uncharacterized membrane protein YdjX (TVP38/TMEM64 family)